MFSISFDKQNYEIALTQTQTQTQTKFIQQKYIQVPYQVNMSFLEIQITI